MKPTRTTTILGVIALAALPLASPARGGGQATCFGKAATMTATGKNFEGTSGNDVIVGNYKSDATVHGRGGNDRICVNTSFGFLKLYGDGGNDKIKGDRAQLFGGAGRDVLKDWVGSGSVEGGPGADRLFGGGGTDHLFGNGGDDYLDLGAHSGYAYGGDGTDTCVNTNPDYVIDSCEK